MTIGKSQYEEEEAEEEDEEEQAIFTKHSKLKTCSVIVLKAHDSQNRLESFQAFSLILNFPPTQQQKFSVYINMCLNNQPQGKLFQSEPCMLSVACRQGRD